MYRVADEFGGATLRSRAAAEAWLVRYFLHASTDVSDIATLVGLPAAVAPAPPMSDPQFDEHVAEWALGEAEEGPRARAHSWAAQLTCAVEGEAAACAQTADELGAAVTSVEDAIAVLTDVSSTVVRFLSGALHRTCNDVGLNSPAHGTRSHAQPALFHLRQHRTQSRAVARCQNAPRLLADQFGADGGDADCAACDTAEGPPQPRHPAEGRRAVPALVAPLIACA